MVVRKKVVRVCRECHRVVEGENCTICSTSSLSEDWAGYVVIIDPERSEIAKKMNVTMAGRYALKVR
ncbi:MAG: DNA-directed RNA polymerase, subunit E'' [Methanoculleus sp.]|nr:DNA-directed RNA polymerase, subunit E'' [Methanoculleus sp.]